MLAFWCLSSGPLQHLHGSDRWQECYPKNMIAGKAHALLQSSEHRTIWIESDSTLVRLCNTIVEPFNYWLWLCIFLKLQTSFSSTPAPCHMCMPVWQFENCKSRRKLTLHFQDSQSYRSSASPASPEKIQFPTSGKTNCNFLGEGQQTLHREHSFKSLLFWNYKSW